MTKKYSLICPTFKGNDAAFPMALLVRKAKPDWQAGRLNLVGGKVEDGESFLDAARREFKEETDLIATDYELLGTVKSDRSDFIMDVFTCNVVGDWNAITYEPAEPVSWHYWHQVKDNPALMDNIRFIYPMALAGVSGWTLQYDDHGNGERAPVLHLTSPAFSL